MPTLPKRSKEDVKLFNKDLTKSNKYRFKILSKGRAFKKIHPGAMIHFGYNPKFKDVLPFWDKTPTIIVLRARGNRMLGLNLHFIPQERRVALIKYIIKKNKKNISNNLPLFIDYRGIKGFLAAAGLTVTIRLYIITRITSKITMVNNYKDYITGALELKTEKIYGMSSSEIYRRFLGVKSKKKKSKR